MRTAARSLRECRASVGGRACTPCGQNVNKPHSSPVGVRALQQLPVSRVGRVHVLFLVRGVLERSARGSRPGGRRFGALPGYGRRVGCLIRFWGVDQMNFV